jgi:hypothetical protein
MLSSEPLARRVSSTLLSGQCAAVVHDGRDLLGTVLQADFQFFDLFGGLLGALGKAADRN